MKSSALLTPLLLSFGALASAASSWSFKDGKVTVLGQRYKDGGNKLTLSPSKPMSDPVSLHMSDKIKLQLQSTEGGKGKRAHQVFLTLTQKSSGLSDSWPLDVKSDGSAKMDLPVKEIPPQLLTDSSTLDGTITIASFGSTTPFKAPVITFTVATDTSPRLLPVKPPVRYRKLPEIHHIFRADPKSPPALFCLLFAGAVVVSAPILFGVWASLGVNLDHLSKAMGNAPVSHGLFFGSIVAMEGIFFMYYSSWNLGQTLSAAAAVGFVTFFSGSRALSEVQERRLEGLR